MNWQEAVDQIRPLVVKIQTPQATGTGFLVSHSRVAPVCGIATAAHVVDHPHFWQEPIRIVHVESGKTLLLRPEDRAIFLDEAKDTASIVIKKGELPLPSDTPEITPEGKLLRVGTEVGWLGYPAVSPQNLCFFSGRVSCVLQSEKAYLVDGVAINGVSGGPTFFLSGTGGVVVVGVVSAYIANRATGETLPGISVVRDVEQFQILIKSFRSVDDAQQSEAPKDTPPPPAPDDAT